MRALFCAALASVCAFAQSFEVASIKPGPPPGPGNRVTMSFAGGPGTGDPTRAILNNLDLENLLTLALGTDSYHLSAPEWTMSQRFVIEAKVPEGATKEEFPVMLKNLLVERFHFAYHMEKKEATTWDLVVEKNGPKFKAATPEAPAPDTPVPQRTPGPPQVDPEGYPILPGGKGMIFMKGHARMHRDQTMVQLAGMLSGQIGAPVTDATGLTGKYDIALQWASQGLRANSGDNDPGPSVFEAVQQQLGLRLQPKKRTIEIFVVDRIDKTPTEN